MWWGVRRSASPILQVYPVVPSLLPGGSLLLPLGGQHIKPLSDTDADRGLLNRPGAGDRKASLRALRTDGWMEGGWKVAVGGRS